MSDIGISPRLSAEQYGEIYQDIAETLGELLEEEPAGEWLAVVRSPDAALMARPRFPGSRGSDVVVSGIPL